MDRYHQSYRESKAICRLLHDTHRQAPPWRHQDWTYNITWGWGPVHWKRRNQLRSLIKVCNGKPAYPLLIKELLSGTSIIFLPRVNYSPITDTVQASRDNAGRHNWKETFYRCQVGVLTLRAFVPLRELGQNIAAPCVTRLSAAMVFDYVG